MVNKIDIQLVDSYISDFGFNSSLLHHVELTESSVPNCLKGYYKQPWT